jgi:hypothetical protein
MRKVISDLRPDYMPQEFALKYPELILGKGPSAYTDLTNQELLDILLKDPRSLCDEDLDKYYQAANEIANYIFVDDSGYLIAFGPGGFYKGTDTEISKLLKI